MHFRHCITIIFIVYIYIYVHIMLPNVLIPYSIVDSLNRFHKSRFNLIQLINPFPQMCFILKQKDESVFAYAIQILRLNWNAFLITCPKPVYRIITFRWKPTFSWLLSSCIYTCSVDNMCKPQNLLTLDLGLLIQKHIFPQENVRGAYRQVSLG